MADLPPATFKKEDNDQRLLIRTKIRQRSIKYQDPFVWNKFPTEIKNSPSVPIFKNKLKQYMLRHLLVFHSR